MWAFSSCVECWLLWLLLLWSSGSRLAGLGSCSSLALEHRLNSCGSRAWLLLSVWDPPRRGVKPMFPALAGGFLTTGPPGKPSVEFLISVIEMLKLKLKYFGHLMRRVDWLEKTLMLGGIGGRRRRGYICTESFIKFSTLLKKVFLTWAVGQVVSLWAGKPIVSCV